LVVDQIAIHNVSKVCVIEQMSSEGHSLETDIVQDTIKDTVEDIIERCGDREIKKVVMLVGELNVCVR